MDQMNDDLQKLALQTERIKRLRKTLSDSQLDLESVLEGKIVRRHLLKSVLSEIKDSLETDEDLQAKL